jgi:hypothetical protein
MHECNQANATKQLQPRPQGIKRSWLIQGHLPLDTPEMPQRVTASSMSHWYVTASNSQQQPNYMTYQHA